ncbi:MAG TPA: hypothetical protein VFK80_10585, partial [Limnochordia bacterium]|nr:hypothetical protein [Limnochordia bacterium]
MALIHRYLEQLPVARDEQFPNAADVGFQAIAGHMDVMRGRAVIPNGEKVYQAVWDNLRRAMLNQVPVSEALSEAERQGNTFLAEGWKAFG